MPIRDAAVAADVPLAPPLSWVPLASAAIASAAASHGHSHSQSPASSQRDDAQRAQSPEILQSGLAPEVAKTRERRQKVIEQRTQLTAMLTKFKASRHWNEDMAAQAEAQLTRRQEALARAQKQTALAIGSHSAIPIASADNASPCAGVVGTVPVAIGTPMPATPIARVRASAAGTPVRTPLPGSVLRRLRLRGKQVPKAKRTPAASPSSPAKPVRTRLKSKRPASPPFPAHGSAEATRPLLLFFAAAAEAAAASPSFSPQRTLQTPSRAQEPMLATPALVPFGRGTPSTGVKRTPPPSQIFHEAAEAFAAAAEKIARTSPAGRGVTCDSHLQCVLGV